MANKVRYFYKLVLILKMSVYSHKIYWCIKIFQMMLPYCKIFVFKGTKIGKIDFITDQIVKKLFI